MGTILAIVIDPPYVTGENFKNESAKDEATQIPAKNFEKALAVKYL